MKNTTRTNSAFRATFALAGIGEPAIPVLKAAFADTNRSDRPVIIYALRRTHSYERNTNAWLPIALGALNDHDPAVRRAATNVVKTLASDGFTAAPPQ